MSTTDSILNAFCWMLIHSLWQGILAAVLAGLVILSTPKAGVRWRYGLLVSVVFLFLLACGFTFFRQLDSSGISSPTSVTSTGHETLPAFQQTSIAVSPGPPSTFWQVTVQFLNTHTDWLMAIWACCFLFKAVRLSVGLRHLHQLRHRNIHPPTERWQSELRRLCGLLGIPKTVRLLESERIQVPVTIGYLKPLVLVPFGLLASLSPEQAETVLLHELAHIRRQDYLVNLLQCVVETVFFFHPALLWISALIREEREACCDDLVMTTAGNRKSYLEVLVLFQETQLGVLPLAMGLADRRMPLLNRVKRMLSKENQPLTSLEKILLMLALVSMTAFTFLPETPAAPQKTTTGFQQAEPKPAPAGQKPQPYQTPAAKPRKNAPKKAASSKPKPARPLVIDTIRFEKKPFTSIRFDPTNQQNSPEVTITAIDETGKKYTILKRNGQVAGLSINDQPIPTNELTRYTELFQQVDRFFGEHLERKHKLIEERLAVNREEHRRSQEKMKQAIAGKQERLRKERAELFDKNRELLLQKEKFHVRGKEMLLRDRETAFQISPVKKKWEFDHARIQPDVDRIHGIMADLVQEGIVQDLDAIDWFGLSETELIVNGRKLSPELHEKLRTKYGIRHQYGLYYGPVQMSGTGFFLDRKETSTPSKE
jgi:bla regulator protein BlaR1